MSSVKVGSSAKAAFITLLCLAGIGAVLDNGPLGWILTPICICLGFFAVLQAPLRATMLTLMFFALVLENPAEGPACGLWHSPFFPAGALFLTHFKTVVGGPWFFGGMDLMLLAAGLAWFTKARGRRQEIPTPQPMIKLAQLCYYTIAFTWFIGKFHGGADGGVAVWQMDKVIWLPTVFLLCQAAFTSPKDYVAVGKVVLVASVCRALQAIYVRKTVNAATDPISGESVLAFATTHNDTMLFALGTVIVVAMLIQRVGPPAKRIALVATPILFGGMLANNRRMVWVQIIMVFVALYMISEPSAFKRKLQRGAMLALVPFVGYIGAGWNSTGSKIFKPVQVIRSAVDSSTDASTAWRDIENFNLIYTLRIHPIVGTGYGHGFWEVWKLPDVDYILERFLPHNSLLGLWCYGGYVSYTGLTLLWVAGVYFGVRAYHHSKDAMEKAAALTAFGMVLIYYIQCFGDLGLGSYTGVFLLGPALAISCKLAVKSGAWPTRSKVRSPVVQAPTVTQAPSAEWRSSTP